MKKLWILILLCCCFCKSKNPEAISTLLPPKEFQEKLASTPGAVLLDVRTLAEVRDECIKGEINFDYKNEGFKMLISGLDKSKPYFVYCASGVRSGKASEMMTGMDFKTVYTLDGGIKAWTDAGLPTKKLTRQ